MLLFLAAYRRWLAGRLLLSLAPGLNRGDEL